MSSGPTRKGLIAFVFAARVGKEAAMPPSCPFRVLLVDDERAFTQVLAQRLEQRGIQVAAVFDGPSALARLKSAADIEVVVLDMAMPGMNGLETLDRIRQQWPLVEIVMLTGHATLSSAVEAIQRGARDYLMKPCDLDLLIDKIAAAATRRRQREAKIRDVQMMPYISRRKRRERIHRILSDP